MSGFTGTELEVAHALVNTETLYISGRINKVHIVDASSLTVRSSIAISASTSQFNGIAKSPDGTKVYHTNQSSGTVSVIDTFTDTISATVTGMADPRAIVVSPVGDYYYVSNLSGSIYKIRSSDNVREMTIANGSGTYGMGISSDGSFLYVPNNSSNVVSKVNTLTGAVIASVSTGTSAGTRWVANGNGYVVATNYATHKISIIDETSFTELGQVATGTNPIGVIINRAGTKAYVASERSNRVDVIDLATRINERTIGVGSRPWAVAENLSGTKIFVGGYQVGGFMVIDTSTWVSSTVVIAGDQTMTLVAVAVPATVPLGAPPAPTAVSGVASAVVTVAAGTGTPESFLVTSTPGSFTCTVTGSSGNCTVTGLTNGTSYTFKATATNGGGTSAASAASNAVTPQPTVPGTPRTPTAVAGVASAEVTVAAGTGGTPTSYRVTSTPGSFTCTVTGSSGDCTVSGLTSGTSYTFKATATNGGGTSAASAASNAVTPIAPATTTVAPALSIVIQAPVTSVAQGQASVATVAPMTTTTTVVVLGADGKPVPTTTTTSTSTIAAAGSRMVSTTVAPITKNAALPAIMSTTTIGPPVIDNVAAGETAVQIDGVTTDAVVTRENNQLVINAGPLNAKLSSVDDAGLALPLDSDGNVRLSVGDVIKLSVGGFEPGSLVEVWLFSTPIKLGSLVVQADGKIEGLFPIPTGIKSGSHRVVVSAKLANGKPTTFALGVLIGEVSRTSTLTRVLIAIPISFAVVFAFILPTQLRRRKKTVVS